MIKDLRHTCQTFFIPGRLPGLNEMLAAARSSKGKFSMFQKMKKETEDKIAFHVCAQLSQMRVEFKKINFADIEFEWIEPNIKRDKDNIVAGRKFILDAMVYCGVLTSDGWKGVEGFSDSFRVSDRPGVKVTIKELKPSLL